MKTPARTILPDNPHERPVHEVKHKKWSFYFVVTVVIVVFCDYWWFFDFNPPPAHTTKVEMLDVLIMYSMACVLYLAIMARAGDIYFYERHVEIRRFLPFIKRYIIYYDKMHVRIIKKKGLARYYDKINFSFNSKDGLVYLKQYEALPKFWKSPYMWLKIATSESISFSSISNPEILEFVKTKAQSVNYRS